MSRLFLKSTTGKWHTLDDGEQPLCGMRGGGTMLELTANEWVSDEQCAECLNCLFVRQSRPDGGRLVEPSGYRWRADGTARVLASLAAMCDEDEEYVPFPIPGGLAVPRPRLPPGRWVPWCVEHDSDEFHRSPLWALSNRWCERSELSGGGKPCRWHPQGAFIPEVDA